MICSVIVFVKNPILGKVKTRVAASVGNEKAVEVYVELLKHTKNVMKEWVSEAVGSTQKLVCVYYGDFINHDDLWNEPFFEKKLQCQSSDLGDRMKAAFATELKTADRIVIVGSDCLAIRPEHLSKAFAALETHEVVIGPADDGGYYLLGMKNLHRNLFENKSWSQPTLLQETIADLVQTSPHNPDSARYYLLETLSDIDTWEDYVAAKNQ
ncbi:TIGR04282 family arsenosugar biosynthesis glycosyltransferase [Runella salmonicolor]|uniref:TIGR04282 family arsenosugar biosynthesis glycosyltransferase n=1 Tax=Runella salmonicolor TaxID=2950278 RepID=A0ABT1FSH7_9BACT|nr:TIGR04282 family arsenosugar biosynthesis glycosyltransferase [Runella salmonicolor]MCP1383728.1 TIGR04282 family arsenosugar biosynthesis glycosyltransferase [Runella salmonicolor]